jgi:hypothetical protein
VSGLGAIERLDLRFLIDRQHHRMRRRIDPRVRPMAGPRTGSEADDVVELGGELRIARQLELPHAMRLQPVCAPDPLHRTDADADGLGHRCRRPMGGLARRIGQCQGHRVLAHRGRQRRDARRSGLVAQQPIHAFGLVTLRPALDRVLALAALAHDCRRSQPRGRQQHDPRPPDVLLRTVAIRHHRFQAVSIAGTQRDPLAHSRSPNTPRQDIRNPPHLLDLIH